MLVLGLVALAGCRTGSYTERGAVTGGVVGGLTGAALDHSPEGALVGGVVGTMVGAMVGDGIDADMARRQAAAPPGPRPVSTDEVATMVGSGVGEQVIINHIQTHGVAAPLSANDIIRLHQQGIGENIITAMQQAAVRPAAPVVIHEHVPVPVYHEPHYYHVHRPPRRRVGWGVSVYR